MISSRPISLNLLVKPVSSQCNLQCAYCYYLEKNTLYPGTTELRVSDELLERYIKEFLGAQTGSCVSFDWHGGEPTLLEVDTFRKIIRWQKHYARGRQIINSLQTNGTLLTHEWCNFFRENDFLIGISIDGPRHIHDRYRRDCGGEPTFDRVMKGIDLLKAHQVEFNTLSVVNDVNVLYPSEVYRFLKKIGSHYMQFSPVVERIRTEPGPEGMKLAPPGYEGETYLAPWSVEPLRYGKFLCEIFDEWILNDVGTYYVVTFDAVLAKWCGVELPNCVFADVCGNGPAMEACGDIYMCDHFVYPEYLLGNMNAESLESLLLSTRLQNFGQNKLAGLPKVCSDCEYIGICAGECPKNRIARTPQGERGWNYLCPGLKHFFKHVAPYMDYMKRQIDGNRAPSSVMTWARPRGRK